MSSPRRLAALTASLFLIGASQLRADDPTIHYAYPTEQPGFFHRVGDFFRDLFATELPTGPRPTPPQPTAPRYNLDLPAPGTGYGYGKINPHESPDVTEQNTLDQYPAPTKKTKRTTVTSSESTHKTSTSDSPKPAAKPKHTAEVAETKSTTTYTPPKGEGDIEKTTVSSPNTVETKHIPSGTRTSKASRVKSPFPPYNELDISGLQSGSLAMDPTTQKVFRVP